MALDGTGVWAASPDEAGGPACGDHTAPRLRMGKAQETTTKRETTIVRANGNASAKELSTRSPKRHRGACVSCLTGGPTVWSPTESQLPDMRFSPE